MKIIVHNHYTRDFGGYEDVILHYLREVADLWGTFSHGILYAQKGEVAAVNNVLRQMLRDGLIKHIPIVRSMRTQDNDELDTLFDKAASRDVLGYLAGVNKTLIPDTDNWNAAYIPDEDCVEVQAKLLKRNEADQVQTILHEAGHRGQFLRDPKTFAAYKRRKLNKFPYFLEMANRAHQEDFARTGKVDNVDGEIFAESYARYVMGWALPEPLRAFWKERASHG